MVLEQLLIFFFVYSCNDCYCVYLALVFALNETCKKSMRQLVYLFISMVQISVTQIMVL